MRLHMSGGILQNKQRLVLRTIVEIAGSRLMVLLFYVLQIHLHEYGLAPFIEAPFPSLAELGISVIPSRVILTIVSLVGTP
ncbi:hypothetical protein BGX38DRAFT_1189875 [Terfezia claveryi]|nr:hypothetical protein BGX38DRAFT_1189875 [Terfezia claveryi]